MEVGSLRGNFGAVNSVAMSADGRLLATGSVTSAGVCIWDVAAKRMNSSTEDGVFGVTSVAFFPNGRFLATACEFTKRDIEIWDLDKRCLMGVLGPVSTSIYDIAVSGDGKALASCGEDKLVTVWNLSSMERLFTLTGHLARVDAVAYSADNRFLASTGLDGTVRIWDLQERKLHRMLRIPAAKYVDGTIPNAGYAVAFSADGRCLACGCFNGDIMLWDFLKIR